MALAAFREPGYLTNDGISFMTLLKRFDPTNLCPDCEVIRTSRSRHCSICGRYVERFDPELVVDVATLTGACVVALGKHATAVMSNHNPLAHELINAST